MVIENLEKNYGPIRAVDNVSFHIDTGEIFGLLGPNGAGKTSIISCIVTVSQPSSGSVKIFGHEMHQNSKKGKDLVGVVPQELINHGYFNVEEILHFYSGYYGILRNKEQIHFLLDRLQLQQHRHKRVKQLSGGMKRRLLIAKSLLHKPKLLLLDEPTAGVDIELREVLWKFAKELKEEGLSILLTTHYLEEAEELCDRVGILNKGRLHLIGETSRLIRSLTYRNVSLTLNKTETSPLLTEHSHLLKKSENCFIFRIPSEQTLGQLLTEIGVNSSDILDLNIEEGSLEDAFRIVLDTSK